MGYWITKPQRDAMADYIGRIDEGIYKPVSDYSSLANLFTGQTPSEAANSCMIPAYLARWGWKKYNHHIVIQDGIRKLLSLYELMYRAALRNRERKAYKTVRLCSRKQVVLGASINHSFLSTSESSIEELIELNYGNCPELGIISFEISSDAIVLPMSILGEAYPKQIEREILILPGMKMEIEKDDDVDYSYFGLDGKKAEGYKAFIGGPDFSECEFTDYNSASEIAFDPERLKEIQKFVISLNDFSKEKNCPTPPDCYNEWATAYKQVVMYNLRNILNNWN